MEVRGGEVGAESHVQVLQLPQDLAVELGADSVELHDVTWILLDPKTMKFLHQITWKTGKQELKPRKGCGERDIEDNLQKVCWKCCREAISGATLYR